MNLRKKFVEHGGVELLLRISQISCDDGDVIEVVLDIMLLLLNYRSRNVKNNNEHFSSLFMHESSILECLLVVTNRHNRNQNIMFQSNELFNLLKEKGERVVLRRYGEVHRAFQLRLMPEVYQEAKAAEGEVIDGTKKYRLENLVNDMTKHLEHEEIQLKGFKLLTTYVQDDFLFTNIYPFDSKDFMLVVNSVLNSNPSRYHTIAMRLLLRLTSLPVFSRYFAEHGGCDALLKFLKMTNHFQQISLWILSNLCLEGTLFTSVSFYPCIIRWNVGL
jgi:hypothetical protein